MHTCHTASSIEGVKHFSSVPPTQYATYCNVYVNIECLALRPQAIMYKPTPSSLQHRVKKCKGHLSHVGGDSHLPSLPQWAKETHMTYKQLQDPLTHSVQSVKMMMILKLSTANTVADQTSPIVGKHTHKSMKG